MDDGGGLGPLGIRNWGCYGSPLKNSLGLQLMSSVVDRDRKPLLPSGGGSSSSFPMEFVRDGWFGHREMHSDSNKFLHAFHQNSGYAFNPPASQTLQMLQPPPSLQPKNELVSSTHEVEEEEEVKPLKRKPQGQAPKSPKPKKPRKAPASRVEVSQRRGVKKSEEVLINGIDLDISQLPTPVCSCTGNPQPCYRWGVGGWQSACCTKNVSMYPLPLSMKRRGARIAGRKMSLGAFKKVLENLAGEGYNLSNPIDLKPYWAKHGTNKFVTIR